MIIACIGWGSLIWDPRELPIQRQWFNDGPFVKLELARRSKDDRITLVIENTAAPVRTLWAVMDTSDLHKARRALQQREGIPDKNSELHVGHWTAGDASPQEIPDISRWAQSHSLDAVVWTALPPKFELERTPSIAEVLIHLRSLGGCKRDNAERYIRLAPRQIDTAYRRRIEAELGWSPLDTWPAK
jgi:hypothetical protein